MNVKTNHLLFAYPSSSWSSKHQRDVSAGIDKTVSFFVLAIGATFSSFSAFIVHVVQCIYIKSKCFIIDFVLFSSSTECRFFFRSCFVSTLSLSLISIVHYQSRFLFPVGWVCNFFTPQSNNNGLWNLSLNLEKTWNGFNSNFDLATSFIQLTCSIFDIMIFILVARLLMNIRWKCHIDEKDAFGLFWMTNNSLITEMRHKKCEFYKFQLEILIENTIIIS